MTTPRLTMAYSGAEWLRKNLSYERVPREPSLFGESVADLLGFCWAGLYHLPPSAILAARWEDRHAILISAGCGELSSWDFNTLTKLVVVGHDMAIRVAVFPNGNRSLKLSFSPRLPGYGFDAPGDWCMATHHPTLDDHIAALRKGYTVVQYGATSTEPKDET